MCEVNAHCPNCNREIDEHETACHTINDVHERRYVCPCGAEITVRVREVPA